MIELNPLVIDHRPMAPPANASPEEFAKCELNPSEDLMHTWERLGRLSSIQCQRTNET